MCTAPRDNYSKLTCFRQTQTQNQIEILSKAKKIHLGTSSLFTFSKNQTLLRFKTDFVYIQCAKARAFDQNVSLFTQNAQIMNESAENFNRKPWNAIYKNI